MLLLVTELFDVYFFAVFPYGKSAKIQKTESKKNSSTLSVIGVVGLRGVVEGEGVGKGEVEISSRQGLSSSI